MGLRSPRQLNGQQVLVERLIGPMWYQSIEALEASWPYTAPYYYGVAGRRRGSQHGRAHACVRPLGVKTGKSGGSLFCTVSVLRSFYSLFLHPGPTVEAQIGRLLRWGNCISNKDGGVSSRSGEDDMVVLGSSSQRRLRITDNGIREENILYCAAVVHNHTQYGGLLFKNRARSG